MNAACSSAVSPGVDLAPGVFDNLVSSVSFSDTISCGFTKFSPISKVMRHNSFIAHHLVEYRNIGLIWFDLV